jgi:hypothetical protein
MATRGFLVLVAAGTVGWLGGCVDRRYVVETNVPGAQISVDGVGIGPSPADNRYEYPGKYEFRAVAPGYEPLTKKVRFRPHWYDYPGLDFFAEIVWPFRIEDVRRVRLDLEPARQVNTPEILDRAAALRNKGQNLPPQSVPDSEPGSLTNIPVGRGPVLPPMVPPPIPNSTETGVPGTLPPAAPGVTSGYETFDR